MQNFNINDPQEMALTLAIVSGFIEGFVLFASFSILISFSMKRPVSCLHGTGQIVALSIRDETLHCLSIIKLFKTYVEENSDKIDIRKLHADIYTNCQKLMEMETAFIDLAFKDGDLDFLSSEELKQYIKYLANLRLSQLGLEPIYNQKTNPLPWMEDYLRPREVVNFFETISTSYTKADLSGEVSEDSFF
jgi:ribonucleoside-diphosphate reductase beta chain